jgi:DNA-binding response OmpR family regulator
VAGVAPIPLFLGEDEPGAAPRRMGRPRLRAVGGGKEGPRTAPLPSVLVVEDDPAMRLLCEFNLKLAGFRVTSAGTGREGVVKARAQRFDLLLLDVMLPDLGGFEMAQELRAHEDTREVPIVFVSARTSAADLARGRAAGAVDYVTKPFDPVRLAERLREDLDELERGGDADSVWELRFGPPDDES